MVFGDLQRLGMKRSGLESPGGWLVAEFPGETDWLDGEKFVTFAPGWGRRPGMLGCGDGVRELGGFQSSRSHG